MNNNRPTDSDYYLSPAEVSERLGLKPRAVRKIMRRAGAVKLGRLWRIKLSVLEHWLQKTTRGK